LLVYELGTFRQYAYSGRSRTPIPFDSGHCFQLKPDTNSIPSRTVIPVEAGHLFCGVATLTSQW